MNEIWCMISEIDLKLLKYNTRQCETYSSGLPREKPWRTECKGPELVCHMALGFTTPMRITIKACWGEGMDSVTGYRVHYKISERARLGGPTGKTTHCHAVLMKPLMPLEKAQICYVSFQPAQNNFLLSDNWLWPLPLSREEWAQPLLWPSPTGSCKGALAVSLCQRPDHVSMPWLPSVEKQSWCFLLLSLNDIFLQSEWTHTHTHVFRY